MPGIFFNEDQTRIVHCEWNGDKTSIDKTRVLTRINGIINPKMFDNPFVDYDEKVIYSDSKPPIKFFERIHVPPQLKEVMGELYAMVSDEEEVEQSPHILSDEGMDIFMGTQLVKIIDYVNQYELIQFPETMFFVSANDTGGFGIQIKTCNNWNIAYPSIG